MAKKEGNVFEIDEATTKKPATRRKKKSVKKKPTEKKTETTGKTDKLLKDILKVVLDICRRQEALEGKIDEISAYLASLEEEEEIVEESEPVAVEAPVPVSTPIKDTFDSLRKHRLTVRE